MRLNLLILGLIVIAGFGLAALFDAGRHAAPAATDFSFTTLDGKSHKLSDFKNKPVLLNFWASWCAPCIEEFPKLIAVAQNHPGIILIGLSSDVDEKSMRQFLSKQKNTQAQNIFMALDKNDVAGKLFQTYQLPETWILAPGTQAIAGKLVGAEWSPAALGHTLATLK